MDRFRASIRLPPRGGTIPMEPLSLQKIALELFVAIHANSSYPVPGSLPEIHRVPVEVMQQKVCGKPCTIKAFFHPEWGVYLDENLDLEGNPFDRSVLLHELVHYLQNTGGRFEKMPVSCRRNYLAEIEAYKIQNLYLASIDSPKRALHMGWSANCGDEDERPKGPD